MVKTIDATFDGNVFRPVEPFALEPNIRRAGSQWRADAFSRTASSFLDTASSLNLEGPADWSAKPPSIPSIVVLLSPFERLYHTTSPRLSDAS